MWPLASIGPLWGPFLPLGVEREGAAEPHVPRDAGEAGLMVGQSGSSLGGMCRV